MFNQRRTTHIALAVLLGLAGLGALNGCDQSAGTSVLTAPGSEAGFTSQWDEIQVVGDFNGFNDQVPSMTLTPEGVWIDTLTVQDGCYLMKLRTDGDWDETLDIGRCSGTETDCESMVPGDGAVLSLDVCEVGGEGTAIGQLEFTETGSYEFAFDERVSTLSVSRSVSGSIAGTVEFDGLVARGEELPEATISAFPAGGDVAAAVATSSPVTGAYLIEGLPPGTYDLAILAPGYQEETVDGVVVTAFETTAVDPVTLEEGCSSAFTVIRIVGDFTGWDTAAESMTQIENCVWVDTLTINPPAPADSCTFIKFRTGEDWGENDYANCAIEDNTCGTEFTGEICQGDGTDPPALGRITFALGATYEFRLNERTLTYEIRRLDVDGGDITGTLTFADDPSPRPAATIEVRQAGTTNVVASTTSSTTDGTFSVFAPVGTYDVYINESAYEAVTVASVAVASEQTVDLGAIEMQPSTPGSVTGVVAFEDSPAPPLPAVIVTLADSEGPVATQTPDPDTGVFSFAGVLAGDYEISVSDTANVYEDSAPQAIAVAPGVATDVGTITLQRLPRGSISGTVAFSDNPTMLPTANIRVLVAGTSTVAALTTSAPGTGAFSVSGLLAGSYDLVILAEGYLDGASNGVTVTDQNDTSVGTITLSRECSSSLQVVGDFNNWDSDAPLMTVSGTDPCLWSITIPVEAGCHRLKFRTNGDWDTTRDWGGCSGPPTSCAFTIASNTGALIDRVCKGDGLKAAFGEIEFVESGMYLFQVDEEAGTFAIFGVGP